MVKSQQASLGQRLSPDAFVNWLKHEGISRYHDHHRYHLLMHEGKLTMHQLQQWVLNRYYYQTRIPIKDAIILSKSEDPAFRRMWMRRIRDQDVLNASTYELQAGCVEALIRKTEILWLLLDCLYAAYIDPARRATGSPA